MKRDSRPPGVHVGDAACKIHLLLGFLLQSAVVQLSHSFVIDAEFQPKEPQKHSHCLDFYCTKRNIIWLWVWKGIKTLFTQQGPGLQTGDATSHHCTLCPSSMCNCHFSPLQIHQPGTAGSLGEWRDPVERSKGFLCSSHVNSTSPLDLQRVGTLRLLLSTVPSLLLLLLNPRETLSGSSPRANSESAGRGERSVAERTACTKW